MRLRTLISFALTAGIALGTEAVFGQQPPPGRPAPAPPAKSAPEEADALLKQGNELAKKGDWDAAYEKYRAAYQINPYFKTAGNLGIAALQRGAYREAATLLNNALLFFPLMPADARLRAQRDELDQALAAAKERVITVTVEVSEPDADVAGDGESAGKSPLAEPIFFDPGVHTIRAQLSGYLPAQTKVEGAAGGSKQIVLTLARDTTVAAEPKPDSKQEPPPPESSPPSGRPFHPALLSLPLVAAGVGVGTGLGLRSATYAQLGKLIGNQYYYVTHGFGNDVACDSSDLVVCQFIRSNKAAFDNGSFGAEASFGAAAGMLAVSGVMLAVEVRNDDFTRRPFHPGWFAAPLAVGTIALATAAGLHALSAKKAAQMADNAVGIYRRSGAAGCDDPASAADCQANLDTAKASDAAGNAALGTAIVGGAATIAAGIMIGVYFGAGSHTPSEAKTARLPLAVAPRVDATQRGLTIVGVW